MWERPGYLPYSRYRRRQAEMRPAATHQQTMPTSPFGGQKPFADYRPSPALSPYLNLFRTDDGLGTVDNYYTLVKPLVDQKAATRQLGGSLQSLQDRSRLQGAALRALGTETRQLQGITTPQFYMNYGEYYPGIR